MGLSLTKILDGFHGDYLTDRLIRLYTVLLFIVLAAWMSIKLEDGGALTCWVPAHFTASSFQFTLSKCKNDARLYTLEPYESMHVPMEHDTPQGQFNWQKLRQLPIIIAVQSLLFLIPWMLWKLISGALCNLDATVRDSRNVDSRQAAAAIAGQLEKLLNYPVSLIGGVGGGYLLTFSYLLTKLAYWIVCFVQMGILTNFLGFNFSTYRLYHSLWETYNYTNILQRDFNGSVYKYNVTVTPFPREVMCDYQVRRLGNMQRYTVQCSVNVSQNVESALNILWIWLIILLVVTSLSGAAHFFRTIILCINPHSFKMRFLEKKLFGTENPSPSSFKSAMDKFGARYLKPDTYFIIGMIEENGSTIAGSFAIREMWNAFLKSSKIQVDLDYQPLMQEDKEMPGRGPSNVGPGVSESMPYERIPATAPQSGPYSGVQAQMKEAEANM